MKVNVGTSQTTPKIGDLVTIYYKADDENVKSQLFVVQDKEGVLLVNLEDGFVFERYADVHEIMPSLRADFKRIIKTSGKRLEISVIEL